MKKTKFLLGLLLIFGATACDWFKDPEPTELPPITQDGKNTFGCKINGKVWIPTGYDQTIGGDIPPVMLRFRKRCNDLGNCQIYKTWLFDLYALKGEKKEGISFATFSMYPDGTFEDLEVAITYDKKSYRLDDKFSNEFNITRLDTTAKIIAGTFYFTGIDAKGNKITVTDGRFDVKYEK